MRRARRDRGFTILEIMLVLALSFVGLYGMMSVMIVAQRAAMSARSLTEATALAQDKLEQMEHLPIATLASSVENGLGPQGTVVTGGLYTRTTTVTLGGQTANLRVQVTWSDVLARAHGVTLTTVRAP